MGLGWRILSSCFSLIFDFLVLDRYVSGGGVGVTTTDASNDHNSLSPLPPFTRTTPLLFMLLARGFYFPLIGVFGAVAGWWWWCGGSWILLLRLERRYGGGEVVAGGEGGWR